MISHEIRNRRTGETQFVASIDCSPGAPASVKVGMSVQWAVLNDADLQGADLQGADLQGAYLRDANLRGACFLNAYLRDAYLRGADLRGADLRGADLQGAYLQGAYLRDAYLQGADLRRADLRDANLRSADLQGADLRSAHLRGADLRSADLTPIRDDIWAVLSSAPREADALRAAIAGGRIDGSTYAGDCACLVGTIAKTRGAPVENLGALKPDSSRPAERFFLAIASGDTPDTSQFSALALQWVDEWLATMRSAFGGAR